MTDDSPDQLTSGEDDKLVTTYLEMTGQPTMVPPPQPAGKFAILRAENPRPEFYRFLYNSVGGEWTWWERNQLSDEALMAAIGHDMVEIYVIYAKGCPCGYVELDRRTGNDIELAYFGVAAGYRGRGIGPYLLRFGIDQAWTYNPSRLWLHTCNFDSPKALPLYQRMGFDVYKREAEDIPDGLRRALASGE